MWSPVVVKGDELPETGFGMGNRVVGLEINLLVLDGSPEAFDEDVVPSEAFPVYADANAIFLEGAGELAVLVGVEDFRGAVTQDGFLQGFDAKIGRQRVRCLSR